MGCNIGLRGPKPKYEGVGCPNKDCELYGKLGEGNIVCSGTYRARSGSIWKYIYRSFGKVFCDRTNTAFFDLKTDEEKVILALNQPSPLLLKIL